MLPLCAKDWQTSQPRLHINRRRRTRKRSALYRSQSTGNWHLSVKCWHNLTRIMERYPTSEQLSKLTYTAPQISSMKSLTLGGLIGRLHELTQSKQKDLAAERDQAETIYAQLSSCQDYMKQSLKTDCWGEALKMKTTVLKQVKELTTTVQPDALKPKTKADIKFSTSADITNLCQHFGQVSASPDPCKCHATGKGLEVGIVGQTSTVILKASKSKGEPCTQSMTSLECKLVSDLTGATVIGSFRKLEKQNRYEISYQPTIKGRHQLHISVHGQPIRESPFHLAVTSSVKNLGALVHTITGVRLPRGIAINKKGEIVVSPEKATL